MESLCVLNVVRGNEVMSMLSCGCRQNMLQRRATLNLGSHTMKALVSMMFAAACFVSTTASAGTLPYNVSVSADGTNVHIDFQTKKSYRSMCSRETIELRLAEPKSPAISPAVIGIPTPPIGVVSFRTALKSGTICLQAFGPHSGGLTLAVGKSIPAIAPGYYALKIDSRDYGFLHLSEDGAELLDASQLPQ